MNRNQRIALVIGIAIIISMGIYVPVEGYYSKYEIYSHSYYFLSEVPAEKVGDWQYSINVERLLFQWLVILVLTIGTIWALKDS